MRSLIKRFIPPDQWKLPVIIALGIFCGLGIYAGYISKAHSYLSDDPTTCINCHVMTPQYSTWAHGAHRGNATCNDCHVPHNNAFNHYFFKAKDGLRHATMFTLKLEPQVIHIKEAGIEVVQQNCLRCHENLLIDKKLALTQVTHQSNRGDRLCWECHRTTPHGRVNSLSSTPAAIVPLPESPVPEWLKETMKEESK